MKMKTNTIITIGVVAVVGYFIYNRMRKGQSLNPFKSFTADEETFRNSLSFAGKDDSAFFNVGGSVQPVRRKIRMSQFTAGGYDSTHRNPDGSYGATWIGYNQNPSTGYWVKGLVEQGTPMSGNR